MRELLVSKNVLAGVEVVLRPGPAVGDEQRGRIHRARGHEELDDVAVGRDNGHGVLDSRIAVDRVGHVEPVVQTALGGGHELEFARGHDQPLALPAVAGHVHLEGLGVVVAAVLGQHVDRVVVAPDEVELEHPRPCRIDPWPDHLAGAHHVLVGEYVRRGRLRIPRRRHAIGQVRLVDPRARPVQAPQVPHVRVRVHESGDDRLACDIDHGRALGHVPRPGRHRHDAVVGHDDVRVLDDLVAVHRDRARTAQHDRPPRDVAIRSNRELLLGGLVVGIGGGRVQVVGEERVAERPVHGAAVRAPGRELHAEFVQLPDGNRCRVGFGHVHRGERRPEVRHGHGVEVVTDLGQCEVPPGRHLDRAGHEPQDQFARLVVVELGRHHEVGGLGALVADGDAACRQVGPGVDLQMALPVRVVPARRGQGCSDGRRSRGAGNRIRARGTVVVDAVGILGEMG